MVKNYFSSRLSGQLVISFLLVCEIS